MSDQLARALLQKDELGDRFVELALKLNDWDPTQDLTVDCTSHPLADDLLAQPPRAMTIPDIMAALTELQSGLPATQRGRIMDQRIAASLVRAEYLDALTNGLPLMTMAEEWARTQGWSVARMRLTWKR